MVHFQLIDRSLYTAAMLNKLPWNIGCNVSAKLQHDGLTTVNGKAQK
jgi:hypothetical protein